MLVEFECPQCKGHLCDVWGLNGSNLGIKLMYWHWVLNPGLAVNELLLGQRQPANVYICKGCTMSLVDRSYVHCPACHKFHNARLWSLKNAFGQWLGYVCPTCGAPIPCLWNLTSRLVLAVTAPVWWLPVKHYRQKLLVQQHKRIAVARNTATTEAKPLRKLGNKDYARMGLMWGLLMDISFAAVSTFAVASNNHSLSVLALTTIFFTSMLKGLIWWIPGGAFFGFSTKFMLDRKGDQTKHITFDSSGALVRPSVEKTEHPGEETNA